MVGFKPPHSPLYNCRRFKKLIETFHRVLNELLVMRPLFKFIIFLLLLLRTLQLVAVWLLLACIQYGYLTVGNCNCYSFQKHHFYKISSLRVKDMKFYSSENSFQLLQSQSRTFLSEIQMNTTYC